MSSLREIEKAVTTLWMQRDAREQFLAGQPQMVTGIDRDGVELYASLLNYGHQDVMRSIYPFCAKLLGKNWETVVDEYLHKYPPNHFNLNQTANRFPHYAQTEMNEWSEKYPYLAELADYEWIELELLECNQLPVKSTLDTLQSAEQFAQYGPIVNPATAIRHYQYPIIEIADRLQEGKRKPGKVKARACNVVIYRDPESGRCRFLEVGSVAAAILEKASAAPITFNELIVMAVSMNPQSDPQSTIAEFLSMIEFLQSNRLLLGAHQIT